MKRCAAIFLMTCLCLLAGTALSCAAKGPFHIVHADKIKTPPEKQDTALSQAEIDELDGTIKIDGVLYREDEDSRLDMPIGEYLGCYYVMGFEQSYDKNKKPKYTNIKIRDSIKDENGIPFLVNGISNGYVDGKKGFEGHKEIKSVKLSRHTKEIGWRSFRGCTGLREITLPDGLEKIGEEAFKGCTGLKRIVRPWSEKEISPKAFENCSKLSEVVFQGTPLGLADAFHGTKWEKQKKKQGKYYLRGKTLYHAYTAEKKTVFDGNGIDRIYDKAFYKNKQIRTLKIKNMKKIGMNAFYSSSVRTVDIKNTKTICDFAFDSSSVRRIKVNGVEKMGHLVFAECKKLQTVQLDNIVFSEKDIDRKKDKDIPWGGRALFQDCHSLRKAEIGKHIKTVPACFFLRCKNLQEVYFYSPEKIEWGEQEIDKGVVRFGIFTGCKKLSDVYLKSTEVDESIRNVFPKQTTLHVPEEAARDYREMTGCKVVAWE